MSFEKLIRDKIPEIAAEKGSPIVWRVAKNVQEHVRFLIQKIPEEYTELAREVEGGDKEQAEWEAADILKIYDTLTRLGDDREMSKRIFIGDHLSRLKLGLDIDQIQQKQIQKRMKKGGFDRGIIGTFEGEAT